MNNFAKWYSENLAHPYASNRYSINKHDFDPIFNLKEKFDAVPWQQLFKLLQDHRRIYPSYIEIGELLYGFLPQVSNILNAKEDEVDASLVNQYDYKSYKRLTDLINQLPPIAKAELHVQKGEQLYNFFKSWEDVIKFITEKLSPISKEVAFRNFRYKILAEIDKLVDECRFMGKVVETLKISLITWHDKLLGAFVNISHPKSFDYILKVIKSSLIKYLNLLTGNSEAISGLRDSLEDLISLIENYQDYVKQMNVVMK